MQSILLNLISAAIAGVLTWGFQRWIRKRLRYRRLLELRKAAAADEVAVCIRVGGGGDPVPDVLKYMREHHPQISNLLVYRVSAAEAGDAGTALDDPSAAQRIIEDIREGIRAYSQGVIARIHFFPAGMIAYPLVLGALVGNWNTVVVYHKPNNAYIPLYEMSKDWIHRGKRDFNSIKTWEVFNVNTKSEASASSLSQPFTQQVAGQVSASRSLKS
jgi:hypothetical protein